MEGYYPSPRSIHINCVGVFEAKTGVRSAYQPGIKSVKSIADIVLGWTKNKIKNKTGIQLSRLVKTYNSPIGTSLEATRFLSVFKNSLA